jgi:antitoxin ParD1/3/4
MVTTENHHAIERKFEMAGSYSLGEHFENFIKQQVASGLFNDESEVVHNALRQAELHLKALREYVENAAKGGGNYTDHNVAAILTAVI